ncbi:MAG TPA: biotin/lipoyl-containing protein [Chloroflexia bacterium]|nr:biotin/lipoyl-containing protein [Chloroflexia bacterium]
MLYYSKVESEELKVDLYTDPEGVNHARMEDGREYPVDFIPALGEDLFSLLIGDQSHEIHVEPGEAPGEYEVTLDGQMYRVQVQTEREHRLAALAPTSNVHAGEIPIKAPMPGLVTIVAVEPGQAVEKGQRIAVLEAMKMENELKAPRAGTVKSVNVNPGQTVEQNKVLAVIE